ncbi:hypothetical protein KIW84_033319 [Lathyrus oleraceus]|uniref:DUF4218 domain-containing protein n=1 Tax=Pisum sativum TaxID=3888 RepID=A0A9D5AXV8_PEA|nr:hypothetical protein KIW84_033319 [Pisum sativum]
MSYTGKDHKGYIVEGYLAEEVLTFCSHYLDEIETQINRPARFDDYPDERDSSHKSTIFPLLGDREVHDPYIEASQAQMVYFVNDEMDKDWSVIVHLKPRDLHDMGDQIDIEVCHEQNLDQFFGDSDDMSLIREDVDDELISEGCGTDDIDGDELISE